VEKKRKNAKRKSKLYDEFPGHVTKPHGKPTLVPEDDKRPNLAARFENLEEESVEQVSDRQEQVSDRQEQVSDQREQGSKDDNNEFLDLL